MKRAGLQDGHARVNQRRPGRLPLEKGRIVSGGDAKTNDRMVRLIRSEPASSGLGATAGHLSLDNPSAADGSRKGLVQETCVQNLTEREGRPPAAWVT